MNCSSSSKGDAGGGRKRRRHARAVGFRRWLAREQGRGRELKVRELVHELHVRRGQSLAETAQVLGLSVQVVRKHRPKTKRRTASLAELPKREVDLAGMRERIGVMLWQTVEETFFENTDAAKGRAARRRPPMMAIRMKALKQMAKLYGFGRKKRGGGGVSPTCATPEKIVEAVRERRSRVN